MTLRFLLLLLLSTRCCFGQLQTPITGMYGTTGLYINGTLSQKIQVTTSLFIDNNNKYNNDPDNLTKLVTNKSFATTSSIKFDDEVTAISLTFNKGVGNTQLEKDTRTTELKLTRLVSDNIVLWSNYVNKNASNINTATISSGVNMSFSNSGINISTTNNGSTNTNTIAGNVSVDNIQLNVSNTKISNDKNTTVVSQLTTTIKPVTGVIIDAVVSKTEVNNIVYSSAIVKSSVSINDVKVSTNYTKSSDSVVKDISIKTGDGLSISGSATSKNGSDIKTAAIEYVPSKDINVTGNLVNQTTVLGTKSSVGGTVVIKVGNDVNVSGAFINRDSDYLTNIRDTREFKVSFVPYHKSSILLKIGSNPLSNGVESGLDYKAIAFKTEIQSMSITLNYLTNKLQIGTESTTVGVGLLFKNYGVGYSRTETKSVYTITTSQKLIRNINLSIGVTVTSARNTDIVVHGKL